MLDDNELLRYSRQLMLADFDVAGQERLKASSVLVVGLGGLGSPAAIYLAAAGVGRLILADGDSVELSNLQRQIAHGTQDCGHNKAASAAAHIAEINHHVKLQVVEQHLREDTAPGLLAQVDAVVDATDNIASRFALNRAAIKAGKPVVSAAAIRGEAQLTVFDPRRGGPCYRCLYDESADDSTLSCSESGVLAPLVGVVGAWQAVEAIKLLTAYGSVLRSRMMVMDLKYGEVQQLAISANPECPDCSHLKRQ